MRGVPFEVPAETLERARVAYETTAQPVNDIADDIGMAYSTLRGVARRLRWVRYRCPPGPPLSPLAADTQIESGESEPPLSRGSLRERLYAMMQAELDGVERVQRKYGGQTDQTARRMAQIARIARELNMLDTDAADTDDDMPRDIDEFRRELARRIHAVADGADAGLPGDASAGMAGAAGD